MKTLITILFARIVKKRNNKWINNPIKTQTHTFNKLVQKAKNTKFGKDHNFSIIKSYEDFKNQVPIRDYEALKPYVDKVVAGKKNILWPGQPLYFAKTSGTTSGAKYIPITKESIRTHINSARDALLNYFLKTKNYKPVNGKHMFLQGSPKLDKQNGVFIGRLSGISAHYIPKLFLKNRKPSWKTNCIEDWEEKVDTIIKETVGEKMTIIAGIPSWVQMYFEMLTSKAGKTVGELFPNFSLFVYGGVNFEPYRGVFKKLIGRTTDSLEFYPASEGFFAYQDIQEESGLLLLLDHGIYYEFILASTFFDINPQVFTLDEVELDKNYVMIISSTAGLWRYNIGDTIQFKSIYPFRILVSGRIKHFISAFGEHVIVSEVEKALKQAIDSDLTNVTVREFTVAPQVEPQKGLPYHEWFIEFDNPPINLEAFASRIDKAMQVQNIYYNDLIIGKILRPLLIRNVAPEGFKKYMKSEGKLGGQNKVPRVSDNRKIADVLNDYLIQG